MICLHIPLAAQKVSYPVTQAVAFTEILHDTVVEDPYRWLENYNAKEVSDWYKIQNEVTAAYIAGIPYQNKLKNRLTELWTYERRSAPKLESGWYYYYKNDGNNNHDVLFRFQSGTGIEELVIDPNLLSDDGTVSLRFFSVSNNGQFAAFGVSQSGSDWTEIRLMDLKSKTVLSETLTGVKFSSVAWKGDGFYYGRFNDPADSTGNENVNTFHKIYYHKAGTSQKEDTLIHEDKTNPKMTFGARVSKDEKLLFISASKSSGGNSLKIKNLISDSDYQIISGNFENNWSIIDIDKNSILLITNYKASRKRVIEYNLRTKKIKTLIPERKETLMGITRAGNKLIAHYMRDASSRILVFSLKGVFEKEIGLPEFCTVNTMNGDPNDSLFFYRTSGFTNPGSIWKYNLLTGISELYYQPVLPKFSSDDFETRQLFYKSKDGTVIPMFIVGSKKTLADKNIKPVLLFGYGGFNISKTPEFLIERVPFLESGGLLALPCLRGGGEYGKQWHKAGTKLQKQNVFDDFISAAEFLISEGYTNSQKLAIGGRSNGGLLVGAVMTQRPDLFRVALPAVGVMDMLRFHKFTIGWAWTGDYGSPENPEEFRALIAYSPYHNLRKGVEYPSTLVTTADHDDRVVPGHSYKFIARLQEYHRGSNPVLIRIDKEAGHGAGKPVVKIIDEQTDIFSFLMHELGMEY